MAPSPPATMMRVMPARAASRARPVACPGPVVSTKSKVAPASLRPRSTAPRLFAPRPRPDQGLRMTRMSGNEIADAPLADRQGIAARVELLVRGGDARHAEHVG